MKKTLLSLITFIFFIVSPSSVLAVVEQVNLASSQPGGVSTTTSTGNLIGSALQIVFIFAGLAVLVFLVWGAFDWITSGGDKEKVAGARRKITNAIIGLFLLALAAFIVSLFGEIVGYNPLSPSAKPIPKLGDP